MAFAFGTFGAAIVAALFVTFAVPVVAATSAASSVTREATPAMSNTRDFTWLTFLSLEPGPKAVWEEGGMSRA
jgi:hypothetical protein